MSIMSKAAALILALKTNIIHALGENIKPHKTT